MDMKDVFPREHGLKEESPLGAVLEDQHLSIEAVAELLLCEYCIPNSLNPVNPPIDLGWLPTFASIFDTNGDRRASIRS